MSNPVIPKTVQTGLCLATSGEFESLEPKQAAMQAEYLQSLLLSANRGIWEWHPANSVQRATGNFWLLLHKDPDQALGNVWTGELSQVHSEDRDTLLALRHRLCEQGGQVDTTIRAYSLEGQPMWLRLWGRTFTDDHGEHFYLGGCTDYSEPLAARYLSYFSGERFHYALEAVGDGLWEWDLRVDEVVLDNICWRMLGYVRGQKDTDARAALARWKSHMVREDYPMVRQAMDDHVREELPLDVEFRLKHRDGRIMWVRCRGNLQRNSAGQPVRVVGTLQDVTARRMEQIRQEEELQRLRVENLGRSELLSSLSHELRTPLNAILGYSQMVEMDRSLNPDQRQRMLEIRKAGQHLLHLIGDVLDLARIDSNRLAPSIEPIQPATLVSDCCQLLDPLAETRKVSLIFEPLGWEGAYILADPTRFKQVVLNLVGNAIKYNRDNGRVVINFAPQAEGWLRLSVLDTGLGIAADKFSKVFEPFNRLGAENGQIEGTGVGLAIARQLTEAMGGHIGFDSEEGQGSVFWIEFRMIDAPEEVLQMAPRPDYSRMLPPCKLLYVTGRSSAAAYLKTILSEAAQIDVHTVADAMKGIFSARTTLPDVLLFDGDIPGMAPADFVAILRNDPRARQIPLISVDDKHRYGADARLPKSFELNLVAEQLRYCLYRPDVMQDDD